MGDAHKATRPAYRGHTIKSPPWRDCAFHVTPPPMNAVEIEQAISDLCEAPFDRVEFPFQFLAAFGEKATTIKRLRKGSTNQTDIEGGLLQRNNIHLLVSKPGQVGNDLQRLIKSPATAKHKAKFALATDGAWVEAENLVEGETLACSMEELPDHFGFFLALAGIATVKQIRDNAFDIKATGRMNRLYVELQKNNPDWDTEERREELNHFFARLIFCFFAEDTGIFAKNDIFTGTVQKMSNPDASNTHEVISEIFRAMNLDKDDREGAGLPRYASSMPYVNGGLFEGSTECPKFTKIARSYLIHIGGLDWSKINPDIFGSMIQAVAEDEERGELGMHYTSVPNILKVLNPLFLDELRQQLEDAGDNKRKLLNLRSRMARIRVFDPACGSGNFLVIAYKELRAIEAEVNRRRGETDRASGIPLTNFRGIEVRSFAAEVARLALVIAKFQCDLEALGTQLALFEALPLSRSNWITCGNALRINWEELCPPQAFKVRLASDDLFETPLDQPEIDFENEGGETFLCGNPPYLGSTWQTKAQKEDLCQVFAGKTKQWKSLDYVSGWFMKAAEYCRSSGASAAFVTTNSICQGQQVPILWPLIFATGNEIAFAHTSFKWANLAAHKAGVTVAIVCISARLDRKPKLYSLNEQGKSMEREVSNINAYLVAGPNITVNRESESLSDLSSMIRGNMPVDGGNLLLTKAELDALGISDAQRKRLVRRIFGSHEFIHGKARYVLWIDDAHLDEAMNIAPVRQRIESVRAMRLASRDKGANQMARRPHQLREMRIGKKWTLAVSGISSENRSYLPCGIIDNQMAVTNKVFALFDAPLWNMAIIASRLHLIWVATVCVRMRTDFSYSNTIGWNTFPLQDLSHSNKSALSNSASSILLARESYWPATIADMYDPGRMDTEFPRLREAHEHNDEVLERIYIGRRFKNDTERLEKLFEMYSNSMKNEASV